MLCYVRLPKGTFPTFHLTLHQTPTIQQNPSTPVQAGCSHGKKTMATTIRSIESGPDMWHRWIFKEKLWRFGIFPVPKQGLAAKVLWNCRGGFHPFLQDFRLSIMKKPSDLGMASRIPPPIFWNLEFFNFPGLIKFGQPGKNSGFPVSRAKRPGSVTSRCQREAPETDEDSARMPRHDFPGSKVLPFLKLTWILFWRSLGWSFGSWNARCWHGKYCIYVYLERLTFKNRGHSGSRYIYIYTHLSCH